MRPTFGSATVEYGKPELEDQRWHFNASHSGDLGLIAISLQPVGINLELATPLVVDTGLINVLCHPVKKLRLNV
jgi:phosphopantetheinyl transferase